MGVQRAVPTDVSPVVGAVYFYIGGTFMFQPGDLVVYGTTGVCRVESVGCPDITEVNRQRQYYQLKPLYQDGVIYTPVENTHVSIRPVIARETAESIIDLIPTIQVTAYQAPTLQALTQHYHEAVRNADCRDLMQLIMSIYSKQQQAEAKNRRLGMVDERYWKQAERLLYGELAVALDIPFENVQPYIAQRIAKNTRKEV